ncbi:unnamed protein product [Bursaphelenchus xylophilus]|uniref:(pine wood nematode) hypothetical protein n=1 Tax=Bursaphelenchus xylophilus TaxID=6326 RepID=A0A1I7RJG4_BURXY|nr:unnamed protein product [Bursaphelenchus xylophilus]CAG9128870.1 unnamed protein product [Bursaphelenchus xylophilus]
MTYVTYHLRVGLLDFSGFLGRALGGKWRMETEVPNSLKRLSQVESVESEGGSIYTPTVSIQEPSESTKFIGKTSQNFQLCSYEELPEWLKDNEYLLHNHRPPLYCMTKCLRSVGCFHTETMNIWSHLVGALMFITAMFVFLGAPITQSFENQLIFMIFFVGIITCLLFSTVFHAVHCHSERIFRTVIKLDYCGVILSMCSSFIPWTYYAFYCQRTYMWIYIVQIGVLSMGAFIVSFLDRFAAPKYRPLRALVFSGLGLSIIIPLLHVIYQSGLDYAFQYAGLFWLLANLFFSGTGLIFYCLQLPERWKPGYFDIFGHSHQIMHILTVCGAGSFLYGLYEMWQRTQNGTVCLPDPESI